MAVRRPTRWRRTCRGQAEESDARSRWIAWSSTWQWMKNMATPTCHWKIMVILWWFYYKTIGKWWFNHYKWWFSMVYGCVWKCCVPHFPNGFADHYPVFKWLFHWEYTLFSDKPICPMVYRIWILVMSVPIMSYHWNIIGIFPQDMDFQIIGNML